eukprot:205753_1
MPVTDVTPAALQTAIAQARIAQQEFDAADKEYKEDPDKKTFDAWNKYNNKPEKAKAKDLKRGKRTPPKPSDEAIARIEEAKELRSAKEKVKKEKNRERDQARRDNKLCDVVAKAFKEESDQVRQWKWHKNKETQAKSPVRYFTQKIKFDGIEYTALAHLHGNFVGPKSTDVWRYSNSGDKLQVYQTSDEGSDHVCPPNDRVYECKDCLGKHVPAPEMATHNTKAERNNPSGRKWPAKHEMRNMYGDLYGDANGYNFIDYKAYDDSNMDAHYLGNADESVYKYQSNGFLLNQNVNVMMMLGIGCIVLFAVGILFCVFIACCLGFINGDYIARYQRKKKERSGCENTRETV